MISKYIMLIYAIGAYILATASLIYIMGFFADTGVPKSIVDGEFKQLGSALIQDFGLVGLFGLHHSITARAWFKRWWTKFLPAPIERATYLYMTTIMTVVLVSYWQPIPITIWEVQAHWAVWMIYAVYLTVWVIMSAATFHFGHLSFFGLLQVWQNFRNTPPPPSNMTARYLYAIVRHPISLCWMVAPLVTPVLTVGHVVFAAATLIYILVTTRFEETDLVNELGKEYRDYQDQVPAFLPGLKPTKGTKGVRAL